MGLSINDFQFIMNGKLYGAADEGTYFVANNAGTGVATAAAPTSFDDTKPMLNFFNNAAVATRRRMYIDYIYLVETAAGTAGTGIQFQVKLDTRNNYNSGGTTLTPVCPNIDVATSSLAVLFQLPSNNAVSGSARVAMGRIVGLYAMTAPIPAFSSILLNFASPSDGPGGILTATQGMLMMSLCPVVIGPQESMILNFLIPAQSAASSWTVEVGWCEK